MVIHYFAHPGKAVPLGTKLASNEVYLVCLTNVSPHPSACLGFDSATVTIVVETSVLTICAFIDCPQIFKNIFGKGSDSHKGDLTMEDEGTYQHAGSSFDHECLGAAPNAADQHDNVYFSKPSRCFGPLYQSWHYEEEGSSTGYDFINRYADSVLHRSDVIAQLRVGTGAYDYVKPNTQSGLWTTWSQYPVGTCNPC